MRWLIAFFAGGCLDDFSRVECLTVMLFFQRERAKENSASVIGFASSAVSVFSEAELSITEVDDISSLIHMDVDQSSLPLPSPVKAAIFESFARQNLSESETDVTSSIKEFIKTKYGFPTNGSMEFLYSDYCLGLFNKLVLSCIEEGGTFCFPTGCNGCYVAAAKFMKANIVNIPTQADVGFKLTDDVLTRGLEFIKKPWVYIAGPTINPTGLLYSNKEMEKILTVCAKFGARVLIDASFSGLEYDIDNWDAWNLEPTLAKLYGSASSTFRVSLLGGLSTEMLTGGMAFGFLVVDQSLLAETSNGFAGLSKSHGTVKYAIKKLLAQAAEEASSISRYVAQHKGVLKSRCQRLREVNALLLLSFHFFQHIQMYMHALFTYHLPYSLYHLQTAI